MCVDERRVLQKDWTLNGEGPPFELYDSRKDGVHNEASGGI